MGAGWGRRAPEGPERPPGLVQGETWSWDFWVLELMCQPAGGWGLGPGGPGASPSTLV